MRGRKEQENRGTGDVRMASRRRALECMAWSGAALVWSVAGGIPRAVAMTGDARRGHATAVEGFTFAQISDSHIGFHKEANPDVVGSLRSAIGDLNGLTVRPSFVIHTGDITHLSKPEEFALADDVLGELRVDRVHTVPGEHDALAEGLRGYLARHDGSGRGVPWYSFDDHGVHFVGLSNVLGWTPGSLASLGAEQLAWLKTDLAPLASSTPIVVFAHIPLWTVYEKWGWGTGDADQAMALLRPFGSVTVLNGHIHQVLQKVEGNIALHTARSTAYPQPHPGDAPDPGPLVVPAGELGRQLGTRVLTVVPGQRRLAAVDTPLDHAQRGAPLR